ncbi:MAG TPA: tRNA (adenosine(37)-N6)-dimethylallyltransferase MiaA [Anaeromyxobacteraceae bacterium]|nr:tRNA (adenosine(37)-N6)-dimethylallyltransferase MiaA [Anaeromyxobacteraceae bacterium]
MTVRGPEPAERGRASSVIAVAGPTGSGKSRLAIDLALSLGGEVVNADSQQLYRGLEIATAKPTSAERAEVPHHLYELAEPGEGYDAARYVEAADRAITDVLARGGVPVLCGGTGLYLRALLHGVAEAPGRDPALRAELEAFAAREGRPALHARLAAVDPEAAAKIGPNDLVRIVRGLEIARGGRTQSQVFREHAFRGDRYRFRLLALDLDRGSLHARIAARVQRMVGPELLQEVAALEARFGGAVPARLPIGYAEAVSLSRGEIDRAEAVRLIEIAHRRYARRQVIWLRREPGVEWLSPPVDADALAADLRAWLERG